MTDAVVGRRYGGRWRVERQLTSGGMGSLYVAVHEETSRHVALKLIKNDTLGTPAADELLERFQRETAALAAITHPNVVGFLDSGADHGSLYLVMELLSGRALRQAMTRAMPWERAFRIAADICRALAAVHKAGIIHRDLKPENVFLQQAEGHDDVVKLIDFGIVRVEDPAAAGSTKTGNVVGTPGYISPEQLRGLPATTASDIYAVGVMLYEMVTGRFPFNAPDVHAMLVKQLIDPLPPPRDLNSDLPLDAERVILRFMERDPAARPQTALDALRLLANPRDAPPAVQGDAALPPGARTETDTPVVPTSFMAVSSSLAPSSPTMSAMTPMTATGLPAVPDTRRTIFRPALVLVVACVIFLAITAATYALRQRNKPGRAAARPEAAALPPLPPLPRPQPSSSTGPTVVPRGPSSATPNAENPQAESPRGSRAPRELVRRKKRDPVSAIGE